MIRGVLLETVELVAARTRSLLRSRAAGPRAGERGAVLVLVALGAFVLLGVVGLGIDASRIFEERRAAQGAVDHAATAAARESCYGALDAAAITAGLAAANRNGYDNDTTTNTVALSAVATNQFRATITSKVSATFSRVLGFVEFDVTVEATAGGVDCGAGGEGPGAIFAGGTCPSGKWGVEINGSNAEILGGVHSNSSTSTSGSYADFYAPGDPDDPFTYVTSHSNSGSFNLFQSPDYPDQVAAEPWPDGFTAATITGSTTETPPGVGTFLKPYYDLAVANGTYSTNKITTINGDGVYYTTHEDGMDIGYIDWGLANTRKVTLVATRGPIKVSVSTAGKTFEPFDDATIVDRKGILILSNETFGNDDDRCSKYAINLSGQAATWNGIMWAPGGMIQFSGSDNSAVNGSLVSWAVQLSGQYITIHYDPTPYLGTPKIVLIK